MLDRAKRVFDRLAALVEDVGALRYSGLHSVQHGLVLETGHGAELIAGTLRPDRAEELGGLGYRADMTRCVAMPERCAGPRGTATAEAYVPLSFAPGEAYQFDWSHEIVTRECEGQG